MILYGVWIPGNGWLRGHNSDSGTKTALAFDNRDVALEVAGRISKEARVYFIDDSLDQIEKELVESERRQQLIDAENQRGHGKLWHGLMKLLRRHG